MKHFVVLLSLSSVVVARAFPPSYIVSSDLSSATTNGISNITPNPGLTWTDEDYEDGIKKVEEVNQPWTAPTTGSSTQTPIFSDSPGNNYPIVLVHGFLGFGNPVFGGVLDYFGGITGSIKHDLEKQGYKVFVVDVGPITTNWERATELYYQIKGGTVDFGLWRSGTYGHQRYGRTYKGLYPEWSPEKPIHLIGHSMGGPTSRTLVDFLSRGAALEIEAEKRAAQRAGIPEDVALKNMSYLFAPKTSSQSGMVHSVTAISSPLKGSTAANVIEEKERALLLLLEALFGFTGALGGDLGGYDFRLDHWGLVKRKDETLSQFVHRLKTSKYLDSDCNGFYDNSVEGTRANNKIYRTNENTYFLSVFNSATTKLLLSNVHVPIASMSPLLYAFSVPMGKYTNKTLLGSESAKWHENDGLANYYAMESFEGDSMAKSLSLDLLSKKLGKVKKSPSKGIWTNLGMVDHYDHLDIVGLLTTVSNKHVYRIYRNVAHIVTSLPPRGY